VTNAVATVRNSSKLENLKSQGRSEIALGVLSGYEQLQKMVEEAIQIVGRSDILFSTLNSAKSAEPTRASMACSSFDTSDLTHNCKRLRNSSPVQHERFRPTQPHPCGVTSYASSPTRHYCRL
jgi:hypothetical protein